MRQAKPVVIVIGGPTASGKTALGIQMALSCHTEVLSADSRQLFSELKIGVARPTDEELGIVHHHLIASHSITQPMSAGEYAQEATSILRNLLYTRGIAVVVGGTGFYIDALFGAIDTYTPVGNALRHEINELHEKEGLTGLQEALLKEDPEAYSRIAMDNPARVKRALELVLTSGKSLQHIFDEAKTTRKSEFEDCIVLKFWLNPEREELYERINKRCDAMIEEGFIEEAKNCLPYRESNALKTVGYTEAFQYLDGTYSYDAFVDAFKQRSRNYAKRQVTWFRNSKDFISLDPHDAEGRIFETLKLHGYTIHQ